MNILAIETSCDETAAAVVKDGREVLSSVVASQIDIHAAYGGVVPEVAARAHVQAIIPTIEEALSSLSEYTPGVGSGSPDVCGAPESYWDSIDAIAVTQGPGLIGSLIVGTETARTLAILKEKPLITVNHLEGHIYANWIGAVSNFQILISNQFSNSKFQNKDRHSDHSSVIPAKAGIQTNKIDSRLRGNDKKNENNNTSVPQFPLIALLVSGGHTMLIHMKSHYKFEVVGQTRDDAAGEAFDKVAALLALPYPGGPNISKLAEKGSPDKYTFPIVDLTPKPKRNSDGFLEYSEPSLDFSFSGLKTAALNVVKQKERDSSAHRSAKSLGMTERGGNDKASIAASFQKTLVDTLAQNSQRAIKKYKPNSFILSGGVAANEKLRQELQKMCKELNVDFHMPELKYCTDNAAMIGAAAFYKQKKFGVTEPKTLEPAPTLKL